MANWYGTSRTNYVRVADIEGLKKSLAPFPDIELSQHPSEPDYWMFSGCGESGGFPSWTLDEDDKETEFDMAIHVAPFLAPGEVLIAMEIGAEKLRYLNGSACAYMFDGKEVHATILTLNEIYVRAAQKFDVDPHSIAPAIYQELSELSKQDRRAVEAPRPR